MLILSQFQAACRANPRKAFIAGLALAAGLTLGFADRLLAGPVRRWAERTINSDLKGYTVRIARARPHLWRAGLDLDDLVLVQDSHPEPPVADFGAIQFSLDWRTLLHFKWNGNLTLLRPALHIDLAQIREAAASQVSLKDQGWQRAVEAIYPVKLDRVAIQDGSLLYLSSDPASKPLQLTRVTLIAANVRNVAAARGTFPSPVTLEAVLFDSGTVRFKGAADFLREPFPAATGELQLGRVPLDRLTPLAQDYQLKTTGGFLSAQGSLEYTPERQTAHLKDVLLEDLGVDYVTSKATQALEAEHTRQAAALARSVRNAPRMLLQMDRLRMVRSQLGFIDRSAAPPYRLFMSDMSLELDHLSNQDLHGSSGFQARGSFMGSGTTALSGGIRSSASPVDLDARLQLEDARLTDLNDFLRAHLGLEVAGGSFSVFTEFKVKGGRVEGYFKPLFKDLKFYDRARDQHKPFIKRTELHLLQALAVLLKNRSTREVATVTRISGSTSDPKVGEWEAIRKLIGNGLAKAILPGFQDRTGTRP